MKTDPAIFGKRAAMFACLIIVASCVSTDDQSSFDHAAAAEKVDGLTDAESRIRADVEYLADDAMEGREAGTRGYDAAAEYVAARMAGLQLAPGNQGGWFQAVPLRTASSTPEASQMAVTNANGETTELTFLEDFKLFPSLEKDAIAFEAPAVFVGYGVYAPEVGYNDYEGLDIEGKVVVRFGGAPDTFDSDARAHYGSSATKAKYIANQGAVAIIGIYTEAGEKQFPWERVQRNPVARSTTWIGPDGVADVSGPGLNGYIGINPDSTEILFDGAARSYSDVRAEQAQEGSAPRGFDLPVSIAVSGASTFEDVLSDNVVGVIEGADPALKNEALIITAHLDHVGIDEHERGKKDDIINNGAMDNALGVAMLLETARRFQEGPPPARTVVFLAVTAEEKGLLGADYFAHFPTLGGKEIVANVNLDMPLMLHSFTDIVAFGGERSSLGPLAEEALASIGVTVSPDPLPEQGIFTRSDHYRFVEQGVPSVFLWPGFADGGEEVISEFLAKHYHNVSDDLSLPILWNDAARFADVNYKIAREIADRPERPVWNEGDFFGDLFTSKKAD